MQTMGETRPEVEKDFIKAAEDIINKMKHEVKPFYLCYAGKTDENLRGATVNGLYAQAAWRGHWQMQYQRPQPFLGLLTIYINNPLGICEWVPDLCVPLDIPLNPNMLSDRREDQFESVMEQGKKLNVLVS